MQEIEYEGIILCLEGIVKEFTDSIGPYSVELIFTLSNQFLEHKQAAFLKAD